MEDKQNTDELGGEFGTERRRSRSGVPNSGGAEEGGVGDHEVVEKTDDGDEQEPWEEVGKNQEEDRDIHEKHNELERPIRLGGWSKSGKGRRLVKKGKTDKEGAAKVLARVTTSPQLQEMEQTDYVIEAASEKLPVKQEIFRKLDRICAGHVILTTNTSTFSITKIASATGRPEKVMGMHFMNPAPLMQLVELVRGLVTSDDTFQIVRELTLRMGKVPVVAQDYPGFLSSRLIFALINEAICCLHEGVGSRDERRPFPQDRYRHQNAWLWQSIVRQDLEEIHQAQRQHKEVFLYRVLRRVFSLLLYSIERYCPKGQRKYSQRSPRASHNKGPSYN